MRKKYYTFNPDTRTYDRVYPNFAQRFLTNLRRAIFFVIFGGVTFLAFHLFVDEPTVAEVESEKTYVSSQYKQLLLQYELLSQRVDHLTDVIDEVYKHDNNLYRVMLEVEPVSPEVRNAGYAGTNRYDGLMRLDEAEFVVEIVQKVDLLEKMVCMQIKSFDELVALRKEHKERLNHIPQIQPIKNEDLKRMASGYGYRIDPVYNVRTFHKGMDFACDKQTPIFATADGVIEHARWMSGYGYTVVIDHGYGYKTLYAHLLDKNFLVKKGQKVKRGQQIALSGNSGKSTGPHLHYEVIHNGKHMNPINYYFDDLNPDEYEQMLQMVDNYGKTYETDYLKETQNAPEHGTQPE